MYKATIFKQETACSKLGISQSFALGMLTLEIWEGNSVVLRVLAVCEDDLPQTVREAAPKVHQGAGVTYTQRISH